MTEKDPLQGRAREHGAELAGKYMTFRLGEETYGVGILQVRDINRMAAITRVPGTVEFVRGVINLRGKVIPVIDPRLKLGMGRIDETPWTIIIVVQYQRRGQKTTMGILADEVLDVMDLKQDQIEPPPDFAGGQQNVDLLLGVAKDASRVIFLLNVERMLSAAENDSLVAIDDDHNGIAPSDV